MEQRVAVAVAVGRQDTADRLSQRYAMSAQGAFLLFGLFAEGGELRVEELGGEGAGEGFDGGLLGGGEWRGCGNLREGAGEFGFADRLGGLLKGLDGGDGYEGFEALLVELHFPADDG